MFIPDPGSWFLPIPDPKTATKERGEKKFVVITFYVATNFTKLHIILVLMCWRKKLGPIFKELKNFLPKHLSISSQKYGFKIRDPEKTYSGSKVLGSRGQKRHWIPDPDPQHWRLLLKNYIYRYDTKKGQVIVMDLDLNRVDPCSFEFFDRIRTSNTDPD